jgi:two-component system sensor histidine kinase/response regulator
MSESALPNPSIAQSLDALQAQLAAIVASSDDAIVGKNFDGIIQSWNASAQRIFG